MYCRDLSLVAKKALRLSLSLSFSKRARTFAEKRVKTTQLCGCFWCSSFFFSEEEDSLWAKEDRPRFESEEKERSEMYTIDERVFFFLFVERELVHTKRKLLKP